MKDEKVYIEGYVVGFLSGTDGTREKKIQVASGEIVSIDENFIYKSIEPQNVVVPQFVADWLKLSKNIGRSLFGAMRVFEKDDDVKKWLQWSENQELFARAWLDGYEVEKEKRYRVRFKGFNHRYIILKYDKYDKTWFVGGKIEFEFYRAEHTRKELEDAGFSWVFNCPGIEVEEVEE
jgi:hypothetical protein